MIPVVVLSSDIRHWTNLGTPCSDQSYQKEIVHGSTTGKLWAFDLGSNRDVCTLLVPFVYLFVSLEYVFIISTFLVPLLDDFKPRSYRTVTPKGGGRHAVWGTGSCMISSLARTYLPAN